ncbi:MAG: hypothetical protein KIT80_02845 [Chitinophagaceae bacterium]|nr:hypothetical protein [Chitinophagaceae bacterium]MCW5925823.1 hypothetical protein [Chitinophagaceae bacterium]
MKKKLPVVIIGSSPTGRDEKLPAYYFDSRPVRKIKKGCIEMRPVLNPISYEKPRQK